MSKVLDVFKSVPGAIAQGARRGEYVQILRRAARKVGSAVENYDAELPTSDATPGFKGKGLLTALLDTGGTELKRRRDMEDGMKQAMVKPLMEKYWTGDLSDEEREAVANEIRRVLGGGKHSKDFLSKMFDVGGQIHGLNKHLNPPPGMMAEAQGTGGEGVKGGSEGMASSGLSNTAAPLQPPPELMSQLESGQTVNLTPPPAPAQPNPLHTAVGKMFPTKPVVMGDEAKLGLQHKNAMELAQLNTGSREDIAATNAAAKTAQEQTAIDAGKYSKTRPRPQIKTVKDPETQKTYYLSIDRDPVTGQVTQDLLDDYEAAANPSSAAGPRPKQGFILSGGRPVSVLLSPQTNQVIPGSENPNVLPPAAMLPRLSEREAIAIDDDGVMHTYPLRSSRVPDLSQVSDAGSAPSAAPPPSGPTLLPASARPQAGGLGAATPPPAPAGTAPTTPARPAPQQPGSRALPDSLNPVGSFNQSKQREIPVREAYTQLVGAPEFPDAPSMMKFARVADDPVRSRKLGQALKLTFDGIEQAEKSHGSLLNLFKLYAGIPAAEISAKVSTYSEGIGEMLKGDPELQDAYNQTMAALATVVGLRSLTKASAAEASISKIEREIPLLGLNSFSSRDAYGKLARLMLEVYNGAKNTPTVKREELEFIKKQVDQLNRLAAGSAIRTPPTGSSGQASPTTPTPSGSTGGVRIRRVN